MNFYNKLLDKIWAASRSVGAVRTLALVSLTESVFFPVPPDLLLIPMILSRPKQAFKLAAICLVASVAGAAVGYVIDKFFMSIIGMGIINFYGLQEQYLQVQELYIEYSALAVAIAALTPIPFKLCTITAGGFGINFMVFILVSFIFRGLRFFAIAALLYFFGERARYFLEKRLDLLLLLSLVLLIGGFVLVKYFPWSG